MSTVKIATLALKTDGSSRVPTLVFSVSLDLQAKDRPVTTLKLVQAKTIIDAALAEGRRRKLAPLAAAVLDAGGHLVAYQREDGAGIVRFDIAYGKAWGSLGMGFGSRELAQRATHAPTFVAALAAISHGRMVPSPGGVLIVDAGADVVGAMGISGDVGDQDEACALVGIGAAGLNAVPGLIAR